MSQQKVDFKILELMASKICHDLISPVGAVANGVEFLEEMGPDAGEEVTGLISYSAGQASAKLQAMRMAYGAGGADSSIKLETVHEIFGDFIGGDKKISQEWDPYAPLGPEERPTGFSKILMNVLLLACEGLPKGGLIRVQNGDNGEVLVIATGENAGLRDGVSDALAGDTRIEDMEPRLVHAWLTGNVSREYRMDVTAGRMQENSVLLRISPVM
ncbi:MAG: hypothetical protein KDI13_04070 [Alphaproteobacteria bacterium]|nr:hypothetical protein [Alphaproteobacteria bacterium]